MDSDDIIEATPFTDTVSVDTDIVNATPQKFPKKCRKNCLKIKRKIQNNTRTLEGCLKFVDKYKIQESVGGSVHYNKPYIYFDIEEIRQFINQNIILKHNNVHLVGIYKFDFKLGQILSIGRELDINGIIELNFKLLTDMPVEENVLSVYGSVEYEEHPILLVKFFRTENEGYFKQYKESLRLVRNFVPRCYFQIMNT